VTQDNGKANLSSIARLLPIARHFFNYEKIITAMMHVRGNDDADNMTSDEMTRKMGNMTNRETTHT
jgi:hypothetical protein